MLSQNPAVTNTPRIQFAITPITSLINLGASCTRAEILTFTALELHADRHGHCWPGRERLASITGLPVTRISKATSSLERKGFIRKESLKGGRVDYYLLDTRADNGTGVVPLAAPITDQRTNRTQERAVEPVQPVSVAETPTALSNPPQERRSKTPPPDTVPEDWIHEAAIIRADLTPDQIKASAAVFLDYHRSKGAALADWLPAWRNWIKRERAPKAPSQRPQATQYGNRYQAPTTPPITPEERAARDAAYKERMAAVEAAAEQRRLDLLEAHGIDPTTGLKRVPPTDPVNPSNPSQPPIVSRRQQQDERSERERCEQFERERQRQLEAFRVAVAARERKK